MSARFALALAAAPPDPRATAAVTTFMGLCVRAAAQPARADAELDSHPGVARKLEAAQLPVFFGAETAAKLTDAWIRRSFHDA